MCGGKGGMPGGGRGGRGRFGSPPSGGRTPPSIAAAAMAAARFSCPGPGGKGRGGRGREAGGAVKREKKYKLIFFLMKPHAPCIYAAYKITGGQWPFSMHFSKMKISSRTHSYTNGQSNS